MRGFSTPGIRHHARFISSRARTAAVPAATTAPPPMSSARRLTPPPDFFRDDLPEGFRDARVLPLFPM
ncbi:hypothetical protein GCM10010498_36650 [Streptomyces cavourensis]|nr:hypothetical protein GCM10010498_36650 [Streptomyces cavourensis]